MVWGRLAFFFTGQEGACIIYIYICTHAGTYREREAEREGEREREKGREFIFIWELRCAKNLEIRTVFGDMRARGSDTRGTRMA